MVVLLSGIEPDQFIYFTLNFPSRKKEEGNRVL